MCHTGRLLLNHFPNKLNENDCAFSELIALISIRHSFGIFSPAIKKKKKKEETLSRVGPFTYSCTYLSVTVNFAALKQRCNLYVETDIRQEKFCQEKVCRFLSKLPKIIKL